MLSSDNATTSPSTASSLNSVRFNHRLIYSAPTKNSTAKSRYLRNYNVDLSSQLGYSLRSPAYQTIVTRTNTHTHSSRGSHFLTQNTRLSPIEHTNSQANLNSNASGPNGQSTPHFDRPNYRTTSTNPAVANLVDSRPPIDENNNTIADAYDDYHHPEAPVCYSYMKDCAIYGLPGKDRKKTFRKLFAWWMFSLVFDLKWFLRKQRKNIAILVFLFIVFELGYCYYLGKVALRAARP